MKKLLLVCLVLMSSLVFSQDTIYLDQQLESVGNSEEAEYFRNTKKDSANPDNILERTYFKSGRLKEEKFYSSKEKEELTGKRRTWREDGSLWTESDYKKGKLEGSFVSCWPGGQLKRKDLYRDGKWLEGTVWDAQGNEITWYAMEERPEFPGGKRALKKYLLANTKKPKGVTGGRVVVRFVIDVDGSITEVSIEESTNIDLNLAAYKVVANMPAWKPGRQDGTAVRVIHSLPLVFPSKK